MNQDEIFELNQRDPSEDGLIELSDIEIANLDTRALREWAVTVELTDYRLYDSIASLPIDDVMINHTGALPALEKFIAVLKQAYAHREPRVAKRYENIEIKVFSEDDQLRRGLIEKRDTLINARRADEKIRELDERDG